MGAAAAVAGIGAVAGIAGGIIQSGAAGKAADAQAQAAREAAALQQAQYEQTRKDLLPYNTMGQTMLPAIQAYAGVANEKLQGAWDAAQANIPGANGNLSNQAWLEAQPGYQFQLKEGMKSVQNSATGRGLGVSGNAMRAGAAFATGLADSNYATAFSQAQTKYADYSQQFNNAVTGTNAGFNYLMEPAKLGENAAATSGYIGQQGAAAAGKNIADAGAAEAAGITQSGKALASGINSLGSAGLNYLGYKSAFPSSGSGSFYSSSGYSNSAPAPMDMSATRTG